MQLRTQSEKVTGLSHESKSLLACSWLYLKKLNRWFLPFHAYKYNQRVPLQTHIPSPWRSLWECWSPDTCNTPEKRTTETQQEALMLMLSTYSNKKLNNKHSQWPKVHSWSYACVFIPCTLKRLLWYATQFWWKFFWFKCYILYVILICDSLTSTTMRWKLYAIVLQQKLVYIYLF